MTVTGGSALGKEDIDRMVRDAEAHAEEDRKRREAVEMRNEADALAFRTEKLLADADSIGDEVKAPVVEALEKLKEALKGTDNDDEVKAAMEDLNTKAAAMGQAVYAASQAQAQEQAQEQASPADAGGSDDDVVDAEIVDDK